MNIAEGLKPLLTDIKNIKPDPRNARKHPIKNLDAIKLSLETYGQRKPIVVNAQNDTIEAGNGLYLAAVALGWDKLAVVYVNDDDTTQKAYSLMDNQSGLISEWDLPNLKDLLTELDTGAFDMDVTGFSTEEIEDLMNQTHMDFGTAKQTEIDKRDQALSNKFSELTNKQKDGMINLICPDCGHEFSVSRGDLDKKSST